MSFLRRPIHVVSTFEEASQPKVYPNPTNGSAISLHCRADSEQPARVQVLDITGWVLKTCYDSPRQEEQRKVDLQDLFQDLKAGYYLVQLQHGSRSQTSRIVKQ